MTNRLVAVAASKVCDDTIEMKLLDNFFDQMSVNNAAIFWCLLDATSTLIDGVLLQNTCINILRLVPSIVGGHNRDGNKRDRAMLFVSNALLKEQHQCSSPAELLRSSKPHVKFITAWLKEVSASWFSEILGPVRLLADSLACEWQVDPGRSSSPEAAQCSVDCVKQVVSLIVSRLCGEQSSGSDQKMTSPPPMPSEVVRFLRMLAQTIRKIGSENGLRTGPGHRIAEDADNVCDSHHAKRLSMHAAMKEDAVTPESLIIQRILVPQLVSGMPVNNVSGFEALEEIRASATFQQLKKTDRSTRSSTSSSSFAPPISANLRRALLLCSKVLSNVATGSSFGSKETFMQVFNEFISEQAQLLSSKMFDQSASALAADLDALRFLELESGRASTSREAKQDASKLHEYLVDSILFLQAIFENNFPELQNSLISASASWFAADQKEIGWCFRRSYFSLMEFKFNELARTCDVMRQSLTVSNVFKVTQGRTYKNVCHGSDAVNVLTKMLSGNTRAALEMGFDFIKADLMQHLHHENVFIEGEELRFKTALWQPFPYPEALHSEWCWVRHPGTRHESPKWKHRFVVLEMMVDSDVFPPVVKFFIHCYKDRKPTRRVNPQNSMELLDCVARKCVWNLPLSPPSNDIYATSAASKSNAWEVVCHGLPPLILSAHSQSSLKFWIHIVNAAAVQASRIRNAQASEHSAFQNQYLFYQKRSRDRNFGSGDVVAIVDTNDGTVSDSSSIQIGSKVIPLKSIFSPVSHPFSPEVSFHPANFFDGSSPSHHSKSDVVSFASVFEKNRFMNRILPQFCKDSRPLKLSILTWNAGCTRPTHNFPSIVSTGPDVDIWVIGMQECLYDPVPPSKTCEADWLQLVKEALSVHGDFILITSVSLWQIRIAIFVRVSVRHLVSDVSTSTVATGFAGIVKNKGASAVAAVINGTKCLFICSHLAARPERVHQRKTMTAEILKGLKLTLPSGVELFPEVAFGHIFWFGDLNYRVDLPFDQCINHIEKTTPPLLAPLYETDQLHNARSVGDTLASFHEQAINFSPTYRLEPGTASYGNKRGQSPSW
jgi:hypothetical protein